MKKLRDQVNAYLRIKNDTSYLKMSYEEVLFPVCKKKYFGIPYEEFVNFKQDNLFKKEIDSIKQHQKIFIGASNRLLTIFSWQSIFNTPADY